MADTPEALRHAHLASVLREQGKLPEAANEYRHALFLDPEFALAYCGLAEIFQTLGDLGDAKNYYEQAITLQPNLVAVYNSLGTILKLQDKFDEALIRYQQGLLLDPYSVQIHNNLGTLLHAQGRFDEAISWYHRTLALSPDYAETHHNLGDAWLDKGDIDKAAACYARALMLNPNLDYAKYSKATIELLREDFAAGWQNYEARFKAGIVTTPMRNYAVPLWNGEKVNGKILLWGEQGIGDEVMFAGLIPDALRTGNEFILDCANARLQPLFQRSFPGVKVIAGENSVPHIAAHLPTGSLPKLFRLSPSHFTATTPPYLIPDAALRAEFRARYNHGQRLIGIAWQTQSRKTGRSRSIRLAEFGPLFEKFLDGAAQWISLQYGNLYALAADTLTARLPITIDRSVDQLQDLDRFAAQIAALDLVITIDNATAHLAGAMGIPTYLLLPYMPDWRWQMHRSDSPWYPSIQIIRQTQPGDWGGVIQNLIKKMP